MRCSKGFDQRLYGTTLLLALGLGLNGFGCSTAQRSGVRLDQSAGEQTGRVIVTNLPSVSTEMKPTREKPAVTSAPRSVEETLASPVAAPKAVQATKSERRAEKSSVPHSTALSQASKSVATKPVHEGQEPKHSNLPKLLSEVEEVYGRAVTIRAHFKQVNFSSATKKKQESSGLLLAKRPGKVRWETETPDKNLLVSDGQNYWFYTPPFDEGERGQWMKKSAAQIQSKLANALLSGSFSGLSEMNVESKPQNRFVLNPTPGSAGTVKRAEISVNPNTKRIERVVLEHQGGNRSEIALSEIVLGAKLEDGQFKFTPPANADRIDP